MDRRMFLASSMGAAAAITLGNRGRAATGTPVSGDGLPVLEITLTDTGFEYAEPIMAGRYQVMVSNSGTLTDSHFALGKIPEGVTDAQYEEWLNSDGDTEALSFDDVAFVGVPDWP